MATIDWNSYIKSAEAAGEDIGDFTPIPAGTYEVKALEATAAKTKNGKDMVKVSWVVEGGPHAGRRLWSNLVVSPESPKAMAILIRQFTSLGLKPLLESGGSFEQIAAALKGTAATLKVSVGEYQGKPKNEVDNIAGRTVSGPSFPGRPDGLPI